MSTVMPKGIPPGDTASLASRRSMDCLQVDGSEVHYWEYQCQERSRATRAAAPTLLVIHGFRGTHHGLEPIIAHLPQLRIIAPDLPGFGASPPLFNQPHTVEMYAQLITTFCTHRGPGGRPLALLGHSFGSVIAAYAAAKQPQLFSHLILVNPIAERMQGVRKLATTVAGLYYGLGRRLPGSTGRALLGSRLIVEGITALMATTKEPATRRFIGEQHRRYFSTFAHPKMLQEAYRESIRHTVSDVATRLRLPTLMVAGARDSIAPVAGQQRLVGRLPRGRLDVVPGVGHLMHYEKPAVVATHVGDFLATPPTRP